MISGPCRLLTIAPYKVLPPTSGGQLSIVSMADALGRICENHLLGTNNNQATEDYSFIVHRFFPADYRRYIPSFGLQQVTGLARRYDITHIFCEHPYMAPLAMALSRRLKIPWVLRSQNIESERFRHLGKPWWRIFRLFERHAMRHADGIFFITPEDCEFAIAAYNLNIQKCHLAPYGTSLKAIPGEQTAAREIIAEELSLDRSLPWLYFLGAQDYAPNAEAVDHILREIYPRLMEMNFQCEIIIGGKGLPEHLQQAIVSLKGRIRYTGYIDDLDTFIRACDMMLNPLTTGGGIKTKAIEALAYNKLVVSTENGAAGIMPAVCGENLIVTPDGDWQAFVRAVVMEIDHTPRIPDTFYLRYNWDAIAAHVSDIMGRMAR